MEVNRAHAALLIPCPLSGFTETSSDLDAKSEEVRALPAGHSS